MIAFLPIEGERKLRILALGELALALAVHLHERAIVPVLGARKTQHVKQFEVNGQGREPLLAADDQRRAHQVIVHRVRKVIGRDAVRL